MNRCHHHDTNKTTFGEADMSLCAGRGEVGEPVLEGGKLEEGEEEKDGGEGNGREKEKGLRQDDKLEKYSNLFQTCCSGFRPAPVKGNHIS